jgi:hypothetical protein
LRERVITNNHVRPHSSDQFVLGDQTISVLDQIAQKLEAFGSELYFAGRIPKATTDQINGVSLKGIQLSADALHLSSSLEQPNQISFNLILAKFQRFLSPLSRLLGRLLLVFLRHRIGR